MFRSLMTARRFAPLFWCQFFSAFNDNFLKNALAFLILFRVGSEADGNAAVLVTLASAVFIGPFFILSGLGGELADRYDKAVMARRLKFAEIFAAGAAALGFVLHAVPVLFAALAAFGVIAALFGPIKYGILPDHLRREELPAGNALVEAATFLAILLGTIVAGLASAMGGTGLAFAGLVMVFAVLCWVSARMIPPTGEGAPELSVDRNVARSTAALVADLWADTRLWRGSLIVSWFWLVGIVVLSLLPVVVREALNGSETVVTLLLAVFSIGIALGSGLASWLSSGRIVLLPTPVGAVLMGLFGLDLAWSVAHAVPAAEPVGALAFAESGQGLRLIVDFLGLAMAGGLYIVPSFAAVQAWTPKERRARVIGAVNVMTAAFMVAGTLALAALQGAGLSAAGLLAGVALLNLLVGAVVLATLPTSPFRDALSILFRAFYRLEVRGLDNVEKAGPNAIVALNHVSFLDAPLALSLLDEEPVFAVDHGIAKAWWVKPFLRMTKAMPLDPTRPLATRTLINAVRGGETLIIFPEGRLTVTGSLMKVYDGAGLIADKSGAMVVPVQIEGLEQTVFSRLSRAQVRRRWWPKVVVTVMEPVRLSVDPALKGKARRQAAGAALYGIMSEMAFRTADIDRGLMAALCAAGERHGWRRNALEDPVGGRLSYGRLVMGANILARKLMPLVPEGGAIGVMLPNANGAAVTLFALSSAGRVPAMINFSAGPAAVLAACRAAQVTRILTSRAFIEKGRLGALVEGIKDSVELIYLEDVRAGVGTADKLRGFLAPRRPLVARRGEDPAAILFTSGSEGAPKGVVLANRAMLANTAQVAARIDFGPTDKVFNVLPVFHAFGLTAGLVLPLVSGVPVYLYPSPLHYRIVPELVYGSNATVLFGTDTFLRGYAKVAHAYDLRSLRYVVAGAEPVQEATRRTYLEKFGQRILEGYGVTECGPVVALNTPMFNRFGTVGRLLPGIDWALEPVPGIEEGGRLRVRGPNVMLGYLKADRPGVLEPPPEGWHDTGDIVAVDAQGFVAIKGRAKRFAKIAGEMISLARVEALAAELWPEVPSAVAAVADARKGERLVLFTERRDATRAGFQGFAKSQGAPEIAVPAEVVVLDRVPMLGTGKVDQVGVGKLARERAQGAEAA